MNINDLVTHYVTFRRTLGERCQTNEALLRSFCRSVGPQTPMAAIGIDAVAAFLAGTGPVTSAWHIKYHALKGFFRFAVSRGHLDEAPLPAILPKRAPALRPVHLLAGRPPPPAGRDPVVPTLPHADRTGDVSGDPAAPLRLRLRAREALNLPVADMDLPNAILTVRDTKFFKSRLVPIGRQLTGVLDRVRPLAGREVSDVR